MSVLRNIEQKIESLVEGVFGRAFKTHVQPVELARKLGWTATCNRGGAGKAHLADWSPLAGNDVVVLPDNDDAGRDHARDEVHDDRRAGHALVRGGRRPRARGRPLQGEVAGTPAPDDSFGE